VYTEEFGIQSYIENGIRSAKSKNKIALFQPLTLLDLVVYHQQSKGIQRISEIKCSYPFQAIPFDIRKSSIALFLTEVLSKTLKEESSHANLFDFIYQSIIWLDEAKLGFESFHLQFLIQLGEYLGFSPSNAHEINDELGLNNLQKLSIVSENQLELLMNANYETAPLLNRSTRNDLLSAILMFYRLHVASFKEMKSLTVLREVLE
jgi:DNA repair protein RecO (recombination protein O)